MNTRYWTKTAPLLVITAVLVLGSLVRSQSPPPSPAEDASANLPHTSDSPDLLRETQLSIAGNGHSGLVWWIPLEFWVHSAEERGESPEKAAETFKALKPYIIVGVFVAKVSLLGSFEFVSSPDMKTNIVIRDAQGNDYAAVAEPAPDAKNLAAAVKPILAGALGKAGENFEFLFFLNQTRQGTVIAEAQQKGQFSIVLKKIAGVPESRFEWRLPLTSVMPPKFCPVGKEPVHANWDYCPWHGVALNSTPGK
jgi:hypothetical protein